MRSAAGDTASTALAALRARVGCELRTDRLTRVLYSTDASNHQVQPLGVAFPRDLSEVSQIIAAAADLGLPVLPRGAGTSLAGQAIGAAVVLDLTRHLRRIEEPDGTTGMIEAEAGAVLSAVNAVGAKHGLMFGPDPASADRATVGGVIGNNASGSHSIRYGMTSDHLESVEAVLSDGSIVRLGPKTEAEAERLAAGRSLEAQIYRSALELRSRYAGLVENHWPRTWRRASGYSLNYLTGFHPHRPPSWFADPGPYPPNSDLNLATLLCGSEGTLAAVGRARLRLVPRPQGSALVLLAFSSNADACDAAFELLNLRPAAVELVPRSLLDRAATVPEYARKSHFAPPGAQALLVVEFAGETPADAAAQASTLADRGVLITDRQAQDDVWAVRKAGLGLLMSVPGDLKPIEFVEDVAVPVERLGEYVRRVDRLLAEHGTRGEWYAHASAGCLHLRPLLDLKQGGDRERMRRIADAILEIVLEMGGALSGEHGDGLSRTRYNERLFGPELVRAFRELKEAWDPRGIMNPGKVVPETGALSGPDVDLRPPALPGASERRTWFAFDRELDWAHAAEGCNGQGVCLKDGGVMCPSYQALRDEAHSTRGRANALRAAFSGVLEPGALTGPELHAVLDLCLECKACKSECPSAVDMARMKAEFLAAYQAEHGVPLRSRAFAEIHTLAAPGTAVARHPQCACAPSCHEMAPGALGRDLQSKEAAPIRQPALQPVVRASAGERRRASGCPVPGHLHRDHVSRGGAGGSRGPGGVRLPGAPGEGAGLLWQADDLQGGSWKGATHGRAQSARPVPVCRGRDTDPGAGAIVHPHAARRVSRVLSSRSASAEHRQRIDADRGVPRSTRCRGRPAPGSGSILGAGSRGVRPARALLHQGACRNASHPGDAPGSRVGAR